MRKKIIPLVFIFSLVFNAVAVIYLLPSKKSVEPEHAHTYRLNEAQRVKISKESGKFRVENQQLEKELEKCRRDLYNLLNSKENDRKEIEECIATISNIQKKIQMNTVEQLLIYKKHLDEDQCRCFLQEFGNQLNVHHQCDENCGCNHK